MSRMTRYVWIVLNLLILGGGLQAGSSFAHEGRQCPPYILFVGFRNEPAFEDEPNAMDVFVMIDKDGNGQCDEPDEGNTCRDWIPVNTRGGDQVNLEAHVLYLLDDAFNAQVRFSSKLQGDLEQDFRDPSRYNIYFKPNVGGAYGFKITGTIQYKGSDPRLPGPGPLLTLSGNQGTWVCGGGSQNPEENFSCVADILQPFPFGPPSNYRDDRGDRSHAGKANAPRILRKGAKR